MAYQNYGYSTVSMFAVQHYEVRILSHYIDHSTSTIVFHTIIFYFETFLQNFYSMETGILKNKNHSHRRDKHARVIRLSN